MFFTADFSPNLRTLRCAAIGLYLLPIFLALTGKCFKKWWLFWGVELIVLNFCVYWGRILGLAKRGTLLVTWKFGRRPGALGERRFNSASSIFFADAVRSITN
jgi:hypothetical protein